MSDSKTIDITSIGHALMDMRFMVEKFAEPDEEADILEQSTGPGGSAVNVSLNVRKLGGTSAIITKVGLDTFGRSIVEDLMKSKVDISGLKICFGETGFSIVIIDQQGNISIYGFKGCAEKLEPKEIDSETISKSKIIHIASLRPDTSIRAAVVAKENDTLVSWDPGRRLSLRGLKELRGLIKLVDIILLNEQECKNLTGIDNPEKCSQLLKSIGPENVIVKMGPKGLYANTNDFVGYMPAFRVKEVRDSTGSGDAFAAAYLLSLTRGIKTVDALEFAQAVAALKVTKLGANAIPTQEEALEFLKQQKKLVNDEAHTGTNS
ncbi:sugar kinase, ribokinase [Caldisphaera lagunensis DSM 15908]|uniref:Sugar kinase, ribokinase n=1 Tax=Caldisphaera lagunensis (strain DSM 15908 / JCM 11604 / ANMR 0165 / IC-154) TaxID=1056495 RepID=L0ACA3_CALLD|nr:carbohydrate kinase family protein [Caldisphaera lagunensis]AFZ70762.1 sugar kinase, ribokinase [Caldisphaera lagunensis DSM 15908]